MSIQVEHVPSAEYPNALEALESLGKRALSLRAAVAFVTTSGVRLLETALAGRELPLSVIARGAPITEPAALLELAERLGAEVSVVVGPEAQRFHPKLWLARTNDGLDVLSGSGNLTPGGLVDNDEQFELLRFGDEAEAIAEQDRRFDGFQDLALPLADVVGTPVWKEWESQTDERAKMKQREDELNTRLARVASAKAAEVALYADLVELYERTRKEVTIIRKDGKEIPYVPTRYKRKIDTAHKAGLIVPAVADIVRNRTLGFGHLEAAQRPDLTVEQAIVLDESKPYQYLIRPKTRALARQRLDEYLQRRGHT